MLGWMALISTPLLQLRILFVYRTTVLANIRQQRFSEGRWTWGRQRTNGAGFMCAYPSSCAAGWDNKICVLGTHGLFQTFQPSKRDL